MGRAYEVRKASIQKTGAQKAKVYSMYAKEIYQAAKQGGTDEVSNDSLKRLIEKAKKDQVPSDLIKRAIDKVKSGAHDDYASLKYEIFGPGGSYIIVECLTDNANRSISEIRKVVNKKSAKLADQGSISYMFKTVSVVVLKNVSPDTILETLIMDDIDVLDIEEENDNVVVYGNMKDLYLIKDSLSKIEGAEGIEEDIIMKTDSLVELGDEDLNDFLSLAESLEDEDDVKRLFHNVSNA